jgi:hypothetical protein
LPMCRLQRQRSSYQYPIQSESVLPLKFPDICARMMNALPLRRRRVVTQVKVASDACCNAAGGPTPIIHSFAPLCARPFPSIDHAHSSLSPRLSSLPRRLSGRSGAPAKLASCIYSYSWSLYRASR